MKKIIAISVAGAMLATALVGCSSEEEPTLVEIPSTELTQTETGERTATTVTTSTGEVVELAELLTLTSDDQFSAKDYEIGCIADQFVDIYLADNGSTSSDSTVSIDGNTITITQEGAYQLSGSLSNGQIVVDADDAAKIQLSLNGVELFNDATAPIYVLEADKVFITTASGTDNYVTATLVESEDSNVDSAIFAKSDLTLNGAGSLTISATDGNGVTSKDDLVITSGTYTITAGGHGLEANNSIRVAGGTFSISSQKDGLHAEHDEDPTLGYIYIANGNLTIDAQGDGMDAGGQIYIQDGNYDILTAGGYENAPVQTSTMGGQMGGMSSGGMQGGMSSGGQMTPVSSDTSSGAVVMTLAGGGGQMGGMAAGGQTTQGATGTMPEMGTMPETTTTMPDRDQMGTVDESFAVSTDDTVSTKGIKAGTGLVIEAGSFILDTCDDAIHADQTTEINGGTFAIATGDDAIRADLTTTINGGTITISTCYEGLEGETVTINGGDVNITSTDDGINATKSAVSDGSSNVAIAINGGNLTIDTYNEGDGLDSNGEVLVTGGNILISSTTTTTDTSLDFGGTGTITGGTFLATGSNGQTTQNFGENSTQGSIFVTLDTTETGAVTLTDSSGTVIAQFSPVKSYGTIHISSSDLVVGETYTLTAGTQTQTIVMDTLLYGEGNEGGMGGGQMQGSQTGGGMQGGMGGGR